VEKACEEAKALALSNGIKEEDWQLMNAHTSSCVNLNNYKITLGTNEKDKFGGFLRTLNPHFVNSFDNPDYSYDNEYVYGGYNDDILYGGKGG
jgi:hypothetical protein